MIEMAANTINTRKQTEMDYFYDGESQVEHFMNNELECYKKITQMNKYFINEPLYNTHNPLTWWHTNQHEFLNLAKVAQKFLSFPATSVPSERLFSKAENILTKKRNRLDP
ncbi:13048_t:CDS:1, partial [Cetraspora pellucida]